MSVFNVAIIGAGPSGLAAGRALKRQGIAFTIFERHSDVGGIWDIGNPGSPVYKSAHFISSRTMSGFAGYPMPADYPDYPSNRQLLDYIRAFARDMGLRPFIRFNMAVTRAARTEEGWMLHLADGGTQPFTHLVAAPGTNWEPNKVEIPGKLSGEIMHSVEYKSPEIFAGKRVLVVGAGNSGCDIACDAARSASAAFISLRRGYHFIPKHIFGMPTDVFAAQGPRLPLWLTQRVFGVLLRIIMGDLTKLGLPRPDHKLLESHPLLNDQLIHHLRHGDIMAKGDVERFDGAEVVFRDGSREAIDLVVLATGYHWPLPFLEEGQVAFEGNRPKLHLNIFAPNDPRLFVVGFLETNGGVYSFLDSQADLVARAITAEAEGGEAHRLLRERCATGSTDLTGGIKLVHSERHVNYADADAYRAALKSLRKALHWPQWTGSPV
jgi:hypothetical protein